MINKFSIILNSNNKISGANNDATFFIDFSPYEQCEYDVTFNFSGIPTNTVATTEPPLLHVSLGQTNIFKSSNQASILIGPLYMLWSQTKLMVTGTSTDSLQALNITLPSNNINVRLTKYDEKALWVDSNAADIREYILILSFQKRV